MKKRYTLLLIIVLTLLLAACRSGVEDVPSLGVTITPMVEEVSDDEAKVMAFTECMRDQGIEMKDPEVDSEGNVRRPEIIEGVSYSREQLQEPFTACDHHLEGFSFKGERQDPSEQIDLLIELAACLRDKGYECDDPTAETLKTWQQDFRATFDWEDEEAVADYEECDGKAIRTERKP